MSQRSLGITLCLLLLLNLLVMLPKWLGLTNGTPKEWAQQRDWDKPTDPRELEAYNFAHSLELPLGRGLPDPERFRFKDYRQMPHRVTAAAYFYQLCAREAGEYIFRTVDKVEGIYQMRAMPKRTEEILRDRYGFEDPADWSHWEENGSPNTFLGGPGKGFRYFESQRRPEDIASPLTVESWRITPWTGSGNAPYWRYHNFDYTKPDGEVIPIEQLESRYAYTWRGIRRERDREFGIAGGELIVLDRITGEILGVRRSFVAAHQYPDHLDWEFANVCPSTLRSDGKVRLRNTKVSYPFTFVFQVLKPIDHDASKMRFSPSF
ncbi:MAG: hypothetical protein LBB76_08735 [Azoarcus sp.]|jgi:hypothetical protein|nr:hypothetical protein [Azoarcus sp.]